MISTRAATAALALACATALAPATALAHQGGDVPTNTRLAEVATEGRGLNMSFVANLQYDDSGEVQDGSDVEVVRITGRDYALAGTLSKGLQIIDVTNPRAPRRVAVYDCPVEQGDVQVWKRDGRVLASYTADVEVGTAGADSRCGRELDLAPEDIGTVIVDLTRPARPKSVSFLPVPRGSHNMTIHPSGRFLYNSNSDLITSTNPAITVFDVSQPARPRMVTNFRIPFVPTSLGSEAHDITFNKAGTRAYVGALSQTLILDTTDPARPRQISQVVDPTINVVHQADPVTVRRPDGTARTLMIITDERAGAAASAECPGGGLHVYDVTGELEQAPRKLGAWFIDEVNVQDGATCTSHVLRAYPRQGLLTISWYAQGVRVLDISGLATFEGTGTGLDVALGDGIGMREVGHYVMPDSDSWSFKTGRIARDGSFFGFSNDLVRGFDVFFFEGLEDREVPPLKPRDLLPNGPTAPREQRSSALALAPVAVLAPALLGALLLHRRRRSA